MGFNTSMIVLNDSLNEIEEDKDFGRKVAEAISELDLGGGWEKYLVVTSDC